MAVTHFSDLAGSLWAAAFTITRQLTASVAGLLAFQVPCDGELIEISRYARTSGGTSPTLSLSIKKGGATLTSVGVTAGTASGTEVSYPVAKGDTITVDAALGGTNPTWDDVSLMLTFRRTN